MDKWGISAWVKYLRAAGRPEGTVELRRYHLERFAAEHRAGPDAVTLDGLVDWLAAQPWKPNTRRSWRGSLRAYWSWRLATGRANESPAHLLPPVSVPRGKPRPAPEDAVAQALAAGDDRERLAILLAAHCGLRRGEIARVHSDHLEQSAEGWALRVKGKGGHVRLVPIEDDLAVLIRARGAGWLFPSPQGGHLTPAHLGKLVAARLPGALTMHTLRHRCGTVAYRGTRDLRAVQELLGHAKPETTALYTEVPDGAVRAAMRAAAA